MTPDGDFLARWSQRKREAERPAQEPVAESEARPLDLAPLPEAPDVVPPVAVAEPPSEMTAEELATLPRVEELTADTDISAFFAKGVPQALRNAALRRVWALDPKIRDFVCEAREYAYDWNVPGGVPGNGPLLPGTDVEAMVARIFSGPPPEKPPAEQTQVEQIDAEQGPATTGDAGLAGEHDRETAVDPAPSVRLDGAADAATAASEPQPDDAAEASAGLVTRRHGSAFPV